MENEIISDQLTLVSQEAPVRRGPKIDLSDAQLHDRRCRLIRLLENYWGEIGYKLQKCRSVADIGILFKRLLSKPHDSAISYILESVCRPSAGVPDRSKLRRLKSDLRDIVERRYAASGLLEAGRNSLQNTIWALNAAKKNEYRLVKAERKKRRKECARAWQNYAALRHEEQVLTAELGDVQPRFAANEVLKFLKSKRYELAPGNLGSAMAGLPDIGCRQSILRCRRFQRSVEDFEIYLIFKAVRYIVSTAPDKLSKHHLRTHFESNIRKLPYRHRVAQEKLAKHWLHIDIAIRQLPRVPVHPKELPFKIMENYVNQFEVYSPVNAVLAEQSQIVLPKRTRRKSK